VDEEQPPRVARRLASVGHARAYKANVSSVNRELPQLNPAAPDPRMRRLMADQPATVKRATDFAAGSVEPGSDTVPCTMREFLLYFLRLGTFGFGGPIALAGYMQRDLVERRRWISKEDYVQGLALAQLAPGPLAAQLAMYLGWVRAGVVGATLVSAAFILPSFVMVLGLSALYVRWGGLPWRGLVTGRTGAASVGTLWTMTWSFAEAGAFVFGSGLAIVPFLHGGVVKEFGWLSERQFLDAVAVAMITPGPVVITVAFIGYLVAGLAGALLAALGVFLPCYLFVIIPAPYYRRWARVPQIKSFVDGVTAAATGAIAG